MFISTERIQKLNCANIETSLALATLSVGGSARVFQHQIDFAKGALQNRGASMAKHLNSDRAMDPSEFATSYHEHLQELLDLSKNCFDITLQTQAEMAHAIKDNVEMFIESVAQTPAHLTGAAKATAIEARNEGEEAASGKQRKKA